MTSYSSPGWRQHPEALHTGQSLSGGGKRPKEETEAGGRDVVWRGGLEGELTRLHWHGPTAPATAAARCRRRGRHSARTTCATKKDRLVLRPLSASHAPPHPPRRREVAGERSLLRTREVTGKRPLLPTREVTEERPLILTHLIFWGVLGWSHS